MKTKICICGGGSLAHVLAAVLGRQTDLSVSLLTRRPSLWNKEISIDYRGTGLLTGRLTEVTDRAEQAVSNASLVLITVPGFAYPAIWNTISPHLSATAIVGALPGTGGFEYIAKSHPGIVFGMQRIPYVCRTIEYGRLVRVNGVREEVFIGTRPFNRSVETAEMLTPLLQLKVSPLPNYLNVSLAPSNAVFHSVRNYGLYEQSGGTGEFSGPVPFYESWDDTSSQLFLQCDEEIQELCRILPPDLSGIVSIRKHYAAETAAELTHKIQNITSLRGIPAPLRKENDYWVMDFGHRFFTEDMLINLSLFQYFGDITGVAMPTLSGLFHWAVSACGKQGITSEYNVADYASRAFGLLPAVSNPGDGRSILRFYLAEGDGHPKS